MFIRTHRISTFAAVYSSHEHTCKGSDPKVPIFWSFLVLAYWKALGSLCPSFQPH